MTLSAVDPQALADSRRRVFLALFAALAVAVHALELLLPNPLPWFRPGLANILGLTALFCYGVRALWAVTLARILLAGLLLGRLFSPGFFLSLGGGVLACGLMSAAYGLGGRRIGPVGVSLCGALGHVLGQLLVAWLIVVRHPAIWKLLPFFLLFALVSGIVNGLAGVALLRALSRHPAFARVREMAVIARKTPKAQ